MRKTCWLLLLLLLPVHAEEPAPQPAAKSKPIFLWEAKHETGTAYLFGTIHLPDPRVLKLPRVVQEAIDRSDVVLTELKMDAAAQAKMAGMMVLPRGQKLSNILPDKLKARLANFIQLERLDHLKVWMVTMLLTLKQVEELMATGLQAMDVQIPEKAKRAGKQTGELEKIEEQIGIFDNMTTEEQIRTLVKTLELIEKDQAAGTNSTLKLIDLYLDGDLDAIMKFEAVAGEEPTEEDKKFIKLLLDDRNVHMADRLAERMKKNPGKVWFVAVGAAHYAGKVGVGELLKKKGFEVRRLAREDTVKPKPKVTQPTREPVGAK